jgi:Cdc6-like AAA superfamily ATPase
MLEIGLLRESTIKSQEKMHKPIVFHGILSRSISMKKLFESIKRAAQTDVSIYISGETGVGKELVARAIHAESSRSQQPFVAVNVANFSGDGYLQLIKHKISNQVSVKNGEFILLGGMMQQSAVEHTEGLPWLQKLPLLGWLFGQKKERQSDYEVMIMIRPSILKK